MLYSHLHANNVAWAYIRRQDGKKQKKQHVWKCDFAGNREHRRTKGAGKEKVGGEGGRR